jgi:UDP-N-acetylmuramoyl-tripeptide--D-alanyl-D-alanine ligase
MSTAMTSVASMTLVECARLLGAPLHNPDGLDANPVQRFQGVSTDSRSISAGQLFVALKGANFDGHGYLDQVAARGAAAAIVSTPAKANIPQIVVGNTMFAYGRLAQFWRSRFTLPIIALTGSNGKTTVKEMLRSIFIAHVGDAAKVLATDGNLNNDIGLPQMMLCMSATHRVAVLEMGMNHLHEIDYLTRLAAPNVAVINMAGTAHIGELGSHEAIAQAKGEIYAGLRDDGIACINLDDRFAAYWQSLSGRRRTLGFGTSAKAEVRGTITADGLTLNAGHEHAQVALQVSGEHNYRNAIAAAAAAYAACVPLTSVAAGLESFKGVEGRLRQYSGLNGAVVIDDTYNANPGSMKAAIAVLAKRSGKRILVLGDMGELGHDAPAMHAEVGTAARGAGIDVLMTLGDLAQHYVDAYGQGSVHYSSLETLVAALQPMLDINTTVLVKGSRFMKMERVVAAITNSNLGGNH